jgi:hypothetical protein
MYQIAIKYTKWQQNGPKGQKIYQHLSLQDIPKFTQMVFFVLKIYHLATLLKRNRLQIMSRLVFLSLSDRGIADQRSAMTQHFFQMFQEKLFECLQNLGNGKY